MHRLARNAVVKLRQRALNTWTKTQTQDEIFKTKVYYFWRENKKGSVWDELPLYYRNEESGQIVNFINEIPRGSTAKMEVSTTEEYHPIVQDRKNNAPRFYPIPSIVNYGCLPQTWENPHEKDPETQLYGDNDPLDVCDIGQQVKDTGEIYAVKVLGVLGMIDEGEMDWKIIAINTEDPLAKELNDISDLQKNPDLNHIVTEIHDWFRDYKSPPNTFAFNGEAKGKDFALKVIQHNHQAWKKNMNNNL